MSWHYLRAVAGESLQDICSDGEPCVPLKSKITHAEFYCNGKLMDSYLDSLCGTMLPPLMDDLGGAKSKLSPEAFPVKTSLLQAKELALKEKDRDSGEKWRGSFVKYDPDTSLWRTHQCSLLGDLELFSENWPQWGLMRDGECWEQQTLERHIRGTGYGLSPNNIDSFHTPNTTGLDGGSNSRRALKKRMQMWRTPDTGAGGTSGLLKEGKTHRENGQPIQVRLVDQVGGQLNPPFPEWLMGWPLGWTDLKPLAMDKSHCVQQPLGDS